MYFYPNILLSFYHNIVRENVLCDMGLSRVPLYYDTKILNVKGNMYFQQSKRFSLSLICKQEVL